MEKPFNKSLILLFDSIRDPRDIAEVIHLGLAAGIGIEFCGNSIEPTHYKVTGILNSWMPGFKEHPQLGHVKVVPDFAKRIRQLKKLEYEIIGTTSHKSLESKKCENLFESNLSKGKQVIIFGTESSGLSESKIGLTDRMLCVPMKNNTKFFTIRAIAPVFAFEALRQKKLI